MCKQSVLLFEFGDFEPSLCFSIILANSNIKYKQALQNINNENEAMRWFSKSIIPNISSKYGKIKPNLPGKNGTGVRNWWRNILLLSVVQECCLGRKKLITCISKQKCIFIICMLHLKDIHLWQKCAYQKCSLRVGLVCSYISKHISNCLLW